MSAYAFADRTLAERLERAEASANAAFVEARAAVAPAVRAAWRELGGAYALFDGVGSPVTQTFGLGLFAPPTDAGLAELEAFYGERGAAVFHEVSPLADPAVLALLAARGYAPVELTSVLHRPVPPPADADAPPGAVLARPIRPGEEERWADTAARGWGEFPELLDFMRDFGAVTTRARGAVCFIAERDGEAVAAATLAVHGTVALLAGASTVPAHRKHGAQAALLQARLREAAARGCDVAAMGALPGSASQRNAERQGFRIAYTRIKWGARPA